MHTCSCLLFPFTSSLSIWSVTRRRLIDLSFRDSKEKLMRVNRHVSLLFAFKAHAVRSSYSQMFCRHIQTHRFYLDKTENVSKLLPH